MKLAIMLIFTLFLLAITVTQSNASEWRLSSVDPAASYRIELPDSATSIITIIAGRTIENKSVTPQIKLSTEDKEKMGSSESRTRPIDQETKSTAKLNPTLNDSSDIQVYQNTILDRTTISRSIHADL